MQVRTGGGFTFPPRHLHLQPRADAAAPPLRRVVFVAGGMGINPLMSMLSWIGEQNHQQEEQQEQQGVVSRGGFGSGFDGKVEVVVLYGARDPESGEERDRRRPPRTERILFLERIAGLFASGSVRGWLRLFLTGGGAQTGDNGGDGGDDGSEVVKCGGVDVPVLRRRMTVRDVEDAVGEDKEAAVVYVCGVPTMTDQFVQALVSPEGFGMDKRRVLFEKWW